MTEFENLDFFTTVVFVAFFSTLNYVIPGHVRLFITEEFFHPQPPHLFQF